MGDSPFSLEGLWKEKYFDFFLSFSLIHDSLSVLSESTTYPTVHQAGHTNRARGKPLPGRCSRTKLCLHRQLLTSCWKSGKCKKLLWNEYCQALKRIRVFLCLAALEAREMFSVRLKQHWGTWAVSPRKKGHAETFGQQQTEVQLQKSPNAVTFGICSHSCKQWPEPPLLHLHWQTQRQKRRLKPHFFLGSTKGTVKAPGLMGVFYDRWNIISVTVTWHFEPFCGKRFPSEMLLLFIIFHLVWGAVYTHVISLKRNRHPWLTVWAEKRSLTWWHLWNH